MFFSSEYVRSEYNIKHKPVKYLKCSVGIASQKYKIFYSSYYGLKRINKIVLFFSDGRSVYLIFPFSTGGHCRFLFRICVPEFIPNWLNVVPNHFDLLCGCDLFWKTIF